MNTLNIGLLNWLSLSIIYSVTCLRINTTFTMNSKAQQKNNKETSFTEICTVYKLIFLYFSSRKRSTTVTIWTKQTKQNSVTA